MQLGYVYFLQDKSTGYIKIGFSTQLEKRIKALGTGLPEKPELLARIKAYAHEEARYHTMFCGDRIRGEWFKPSVRIMNYIKDLHDSTNMDGRKQFFEGHQRTKRGRQKRYYKRYVLNK